MFPKPIFSDVASSILSPVSFNLSWFTNYLATWSVHSYSCELDPVVVTKNGKRDGYMYHASVLLHDCECLREHIYIIKNDDLDFWYEDTTETDCL